MITINNKQTGIHVYGDTFHFTSKFKGFTLGIMQETDNIRINLFMSRKLGWWPGLVKDIHQTNADFKAFVIKYLDTQDHNLLNKFNGSLGGVEVGEVFISGTFMKGQTYLTTQIHFSLETYSFHNSIYTHEFISIYKKLNSAITDFIQRYKKQQGISITDVRKYASWKRYVNEMREDYFKSEAHEEWKKNQWISDDLPF
jgi:hypothetical protein